MTEKRKQPKTKKSENSLPRIGICSICGGEYHLYGNNAWPVNDGHCCNFCDQTVVWPARIARLSDARGIFPQAEHVRGKK